MKEALEAIFPNNKRDDKKIYDLKRSTATIMIFYSFHKMRENLTAVSPPNFDYINTYKRNRLKKKTEMTKTLNNK